MDFKLFAEIEKMTENLKSGATQPSVKMGFSKDVSRNDLVCAASQVISEIERRDEEGDGPKIVIKVPGPSRGDVVFLPEEK